MTLSPISSSPIPVEGYSGQTSKITEWLQNLETLVQARVLDRDLTAPPGSPADGDAYIPLATATGDWAVLEGTLQVYYNGWRTLTPLAGWEVYVVDEGITLQYDGSAWIEQVRIGEITDSITANVTQTQGQTPLTSHLNRVSVVANANDTVTLATAVAQLEQLVINDGANALQVFPASGDAIDAGAGDASVTLAVGERARFIAVSATMWISFVSVKA